MGSRNLTSDAGLKRLLIDLKNLMDDTKTSDLIFTIGEKEIPVTSHSFLIRSRCRSWVEGGLLKLPEVSPEIFRSFLLYIYTGKLSVEESGVFDLLCLSGDFGMDDLKTNCEEILYENMDFSSACSLLTKCLAAKTKGKKGLQKIIERIICFIGENPSECLSSDGFFALHSDTLTQIISSDQLCLEEEEVWRYVLRWAKFQAGIDVNSDIKGWGENQRQKIAKHLAPVISHVRLLLIDSRVFAEEVEPCGCIPMQISLERYRKAALNSPDSRFTPRNSPRFFESSTIINNTTRLILGRKLNDWYGNGAQKWKLIYKGSTHGFSSDSFHSNCDGISPVYIIVQVGQNNIEKSGNSTGAVNGNNGNNWICGGFSDKPFSRSDIPKYSYSNSTFLFCYDSVSRSEPLRFNIAKKPFAICNDSESGPIFGAGADLYISSMCNTNSDSYSNLPHSYECSKEMSNNNNNNNQNSRMSNEDSPPLTPFYNFNIADYEVFVPISNSNEPITTNY